ncbi:MAG: hypothetical protein HY821_06700 [Acidobacteria bacterium]|nr:hypothetical protein [Acidobacteriota bacterium]
MRGRRTGGVHWQGLAQFALAAGIVWGISVAVDPITEYFRRQNHSNGWTRFRPPHETSALQVEGERIWTGGRDGLGWIDWKRRAVAEVPASVPRLERVRALRLSRSGEMWVGHLTGVERRGAAGFTHLESEVGAVGALLERRSGEMWVGGEKGLARWDGSRFIRVKGTESLEGVDALMEDRAGDLWVASAHPVRGGVLRLGAGGAWEDYTHNPGLAHPAVSAVYEDPAGGIWFASGFGKQGAACRWSKSGWTRLTKADGLASDRVRLVYEDRRGRLWVASEVDGTAVRSGGRWRVFTPKEGMTGWEVKSVVESPDGALWMATEDGVMRLDEKVELGPAGESK